MKTYVARIDINFDDSVTVTNEPPYKVPQKFFCTFFDTVLHAEKALNEARIPWREYHWNKQTTQRDLIRESPGYTSLVLTAKPGPTPQA